ncbi:outer membrane beta-barrel protein [Bradyrhizobium sp. JYMT SZCCT0180]|uniref:outer membrane protein n=1 Tax=Bradyrhizobium sp. JYMT SZCCT0180 TaxID=2807666 RepID=UPI001BA60ACE|nr:outer membrane beta-barrel protein [Bradyrhizobium sp. JYMT SZCCT0180]MBR1213762.1 porin family protein [Bradyrhizobium sp. JYMT SZCCT0180]
MDYVSRTTLAAAAISLGSLSAGLAADLGPRPAAPIAPAFYDWSGVYIGLHAGYGGGMKDWTQALGNNFTAKGFLAGGQIGINKQIGSLVFGLELDGSWADIGGSQLLSDGGPAAAFQVDFTGRSKIDGLVTLTGRAGLAADRWFVYAKGGLAVAQERHSFSNNTSTFPPAPPFTAVISGSSSERRWAPTVGFGTEYALGNNWSVKAEYDYVHLGNRTVGFTGTANFNGVAAPLDPTNVPIEQALHLVKIGANYRFGGIQTDPTFAPVRAAPGYNWSGAYVGVQGGYGFGHEQWPDLFDPANPQTGKFDLNGWLAGGTVGVNAQAGSFVFGVEGEWMWTGIKGNQTTVVDLGRRTTQTLGLDTKVNWLAIAAARAGFVAAERFMIYGKAGVALADERHTFTQSTIGPVSSSVFNLEGKALHTGLVAGAGVEYALGGNWSAKFEYDYIKMLAQNFTAIGTQSVNAPPIVGSAAFTAQFSKMPQDLHLIKFGVNYHFSPAPVAVSARY